MTVSSNTIHFAPVGWSIPLAEGKSLLDAGRQLLLDSDQAVYAPCGGKGTCGRCRVRVLEGEVSAPTQAELGSLSEGERSAGYRLSCQTFALTDLRVEIPPDTLTGRQRLEVGGGPISVLPEPPVIRHRIEVKPASLTDPRPLSRQIEETLEEALNVDRVTFDIEAVRELPAVLKPCLVTVSVRGTEVIGVIEEEQRSSALGLGVDLGTTKIAGYLVELDSGRILASDGVMSPQIPYGEDLMTRLGFGIEKPEGLEVLGTLAAQAIGRLLDGLLKKAGREDAIVDEVVVVANTAMHHLLLKLPLGQLARAPYVPALFGPVEIKARSLGLKSSPGAYVHLMPPVAGFVGGDHVAMILGAGLDEAEGVFLGLDIGTNTELVLGVNGKLWSCSCASGPAFEGAHLKQGMRAVDGAISRVEFFEGGKRVAVETIGGKPPLGICGSGALDALSELWRSGVINTHGRLDRSHPRVREAAAGPEFILVSAQESSNDHEIVLSQKDIGELQLAKGAIGSAVEMLLRGAGVSVSSIGRVVVAGAFGTHLSPCSGVSTGMFPDLPLDRFHQVGNAAGTGACMALISKSARRRALEVAERIHYLELTGRPEFSTAFGRALRLPVKDAQGETGQASV